LHSDRKEPVFYIKVIDNGVGMDEGHIERYFIHIGRSYYISHEFDELVEKKKTSYKPVSRFGIGFLTSFLVSREIRVQTRSHSPGVEGLDIYIPNHEGCFFINKDEKLTAGGTTVTLYEDPDNPIDADKIIRYIKRTFLDLPIDIKISGIREKNEKISETIKSFKLRRDLSNAINRPFFFVPLAPEGIGEADYNDSKLLAEAFGIIFQYDPGNEKDRVNLEELNAGIKLSQGSGKRLEETFLTNSSFNIYVNYPPNYIELDVSREKINRFNKIESIKKRFTDSSFKNEIFGKLKKQILQWLQLIKNEGAETSIHDAHQVAELVPRGKKIEIDDFSNLLYCLKLTPEKDIVSLSFVPYTESLSKTYKDSPTNNFFLYDFEDFSLKLENLGNLFQVFFGSKGEKTVKNFIEQLELNPNIRELLFMRFGSKKIKSIEPILDFKEFLSKAFFKGEKLSIKHLVKRFSKQHPIPHKILDKTGISEILYFSFFEDDLTNTFLGFFSSIYNYIDYLFQKYSYKDIKGKKFIPPIDLSIFKEYTKHVKQKPSFKGEISHMFEKIKIENLKK
jgi:hypothetical protein